MFQVNALAGNVAVLGIGAGAAERDHVARLEEDAVGRRHDRRGRWVADADRDRRRRRRVRRRPRRSAARCTDRWRVGVRRGSPPSTSCCRRTSHEYVSGLAFGVARPCAGEVDGRAAAARTWDWRRPRRRRLVRRDVPDPADLAHAECAADVGVAEVDVVQRAVGPSVRYTMSPYGPSTEPSAGSKLKTPVTLPVASSVRRLIQFWV